MFRARFGSGLGLGLGLVLGLGWIYACPPSEVLPSPQHCEQLTGRPLEDVFAATESPRHTEGSRS